MKKIILLVTILLMSPTWSYAAIALDAADATTFQTSGGSPLIEAVSGSPFTHITSGSNTLIVAGVEGAGLTSDNVTAVNCNGSVAAGSVFTRVTSSTFTSGGGGIVYMYYLLSPPGSCQVNVNFSSNPGLIRAYVASYNGVKQTTPDASGTNTGIAVSGVPYATTLTTILANDWTMLWDGNNAGEPTASVGSTKRSSSGGGGMGYFDSNGPLTIGLASMSISIPASTGHGEVMVAFAPAAGATPFTNLMWNMDF